MSTLRRVIAALSSKVSLGSAALSMVATAGALVTSVGMSACVAHDVEPAFRASVFIDERGISIPLPPPSLIDAPEQEVDVDGEVVGQGDLPDGITVRVLDQVGEADLEAQLDGEAQFHIEALPIDLTDHCLEVWIEDEEQRQGEHRLYQAQIDPAGDSIVVVEGCD